MFHVTVSCHRGPYCCVRVTFELEPTTSLCAWIRGLHTLRIHRRTARDLEYSIQPESGSAASAERARTLRNVGELGEGSEKEDRTDVNWAELDAKDERRRKEGRGRNALGSGRRDALRTRDKCKCGTREAAVQCPAPYPLGHSPVAGDPLRPSPPPTPPLGPVCFLSVCLSAILAVPSHIPLH
jgi:hypothetical protein